MRPIDADAFELGAEDRDIYFQHLLEDAPTIDVDPVVNAVWQYYTNDEGKARWRCNNCGKVCHKNPHDKLRCSICGAHMRMES